ncbi:ABC transporter ATP-binding protein [Pseudohalocynthiibacter sp. F2068]|uniref:ABC transporter ATP-binding protein n=1 Tax=Pseudohalocynthiibacter sp. F2068 TaxID=2926418 RepID=UPI001FF2C5B2|nr:ABC transporter ATP-binding protein [Pseudohalocynthiibacter sp. F2068]MCK0103249.1 ABC transporter ATP-binding protein [Pseudohalocynthiibacter sp. F2068]
MSGRALLEISGLTKRFGGLEAVSGVDFVCREKETLGIIGPNGAGKTTLFNLITGFTVPTEGRITFDGKNITGARPHRIVNHGIARTFQGVRLFRGMTVWENVWLAQNALVNFMFPTFFSSRGREESLRAEAEQLLSDFHLLGKKDSKAGDLAFGDMRRLEICRALATQPKLLLLDEPASGLTPVETKQLIEDLRRLSRTGVTIAIIEHDMNVALGLSDQMVVLNFGKLLSTGTPDEIRNNPQVIEAYLGTAAEDVDA